MKFALKMRLAEGSHSAQTAYAWERNCNGQLLQGASETDKPEPTLVCASGLLSDLRSLGSFPWDIISP